MKKVLCIVLCLILACSLAACSSSPAQGENGSQTQVQTKTVTGELVKVDIPEGWSLVTSTDMNGASGADYICHSESFEIGDPYLQAALDTRAIEDIQALFEAGDIFGASLGTADLNGTTWYLAEKAAAALIGEKVCLVLGYECDFSSDEVQQILSTIQWKE
ncbi:MAG: hypothetical protein ACI39E_08155 [Acutalibacteraceae bacterium]